VTRKRPAVLGQMVDFKKGNPASGGGDMGRPCHPVWGVFIKECKSRKEKGLGHKGEGYYIRGGTLTP